MGVELALARLGIPRSRAGTDGKIRLCWVLAAGAAGVLALVGSASSCSRHVGLLLDTCVRN
jgi:hypothetical protein